jgi:hypothetical protein
MVKKALPLLHLRTVKRPAGQPGGVSAVDENHNEWVKITDQDLPGQKCGICGMVLDEGWMQLYSPKWLADACPQVVCKRHCVINGVKPPRYRSIDDE